MTEILTESFCERCGTRYTFESVAPRQRRLGGIRVLGKGLKNFVMSDDSSLDEAMAAARSDSEREATAQQLDAFHRTFNFCMSCRQYTCGNCWNPVEARCQSCAPMAAAEAPLGAAADVDIQRLLERTAPSGADAWPATAHIHDELGEPTEAQAEAAVEEGEGLDFGELMARLSATAPEPAAPPEAEAVAPETPIAEPVETEAAWQPAGGWAPAATEPDAAVGEPGAIEAEAAPGPAEVEPEAAPGPAQMEPEPVAAAESGDEPEPGIAGLEPGASLEDAIAAYEASLSAEAPAAESEEPAEAPVTGRGIDVVLQPTWRSPGPITGPTVEPEPAAAAPELEPEPEPEIEPEPVAAAAEPAPEPEPIAAIAAPVPEPEPEPVAPAPQPEPQPEPVAAEPAVPAPGPVVPPAPATPAGPPQWPTGPRWPTAIPARQPVPPPAAVTPSGADPLAALMARQATEAMWAASSRDLVQAPLVPSAQQPTAAVQPCVSCGISLSANARFCRRCGTPQGS